MNYYGARQRESDKRWDYTSHNRRGGTHPIGYCRKTDWTPEMRAEFHMSDAEWDKIQAHKEKYHDEGHSTADEACACYRSYLLDNDLRLDHKTRDSQHRCEVCGEWTQGFATVSHSFRWFLCDAHRNRDEVEKLMPSVHESISSY